MTYPHPLSERIEGAVYTDALTRYQYSTDASIYQITPQAVVIPKQWDDVSQTLDFINQEGFSLVARGGGTSLGGQTVGPGLQLDFSKHLNQIEEICPEEGWAWVQPGVILDQLNQAVAPHDLWFGPDVATSARATLGGMISNNSAGIRSVVYGKTVDHVLELDLLLSDGSEVTLKESSPELWKFNSQEKNLSGHIHTAFGALIRTHQERIEAKFPHILRRVSGYNLDEFIPGQPWNLSQLIAGSEGTLALIKRAKVKLVKRPKYQGLLVVYFKDLASALEANHHLLATEPSAIELMDSLLLEMTRKSSAFSRKMHFVEADAEALLLVEYSASTPLELEHKLSRGETFLKREKLGFQHNRATEPKIQADAWAIRKAGLPLLYSVPGSKKPIAFVEDTAVAPEQLAAFAEEFESLVKAHDTVAAYYAHASAGCLHIRPLIDLKQASEVIKMRSLSKAVLELVLKYGGAMSGEHGDGLARSEYNEALFGSDIYQAFQEVKNMFDPDKRFNPGKIVNAPSMTDNLRYNPDYAPQQNKGTLSFEKEGGYIQLVEQCNGCGGCRKTSGIMCPTFIATGDENLSTRGRANALRMLMDEQYTLNTEEKGVLHHTLLNCIGCKGCKAECPSNVDMAKLKTAYLETHYKTHALPLRTQFFSNIKRLNHWGSKMAPLSNQVAKSPLFRKLLNKILSVSEERSLPLFSNITFEKWFHKAHSPKRSQEQVVLFNDCFMNYNHPEVGKASVALLEHMGFEVILPAQVCCGRPALSQGHMKLAQKQARTLLKTYTPYLEKTLPVVGCEPSCVLSFQEEYLDLFSSAEAKRLAQQSQTLQHFILQHSEKLQFQGPQTQLHYHEHCHQKSTHGSQTSIDTLNLPGHYQTELIEAGCCGMAGSFGFEDENIELSKKIAGHQLLPALEKIDSDSQIVISGMSCRQQIESLSSRKVMHLAEVIAQALI